MSGYFVRKRRTIEIWDWRGRIVEDGAYHVDHGVQEKFAVGARGGPCAGPRLMVASGQTFFIAWSME